MSVEIFGEIALRATVRAAGAAAPRLLLGAEVGAAGVSQGQVHDGTAVFLWIGDEVGNGRLVVYLGAGVVAHGQELAKKGAGGGLAGQVEGNGRFFDARLTQQHVQIVGSSIGTVANHHPGQFFQQNEYEWGIAKSTAILRQFRDGSSGASPGPDPVGSTLQCLQWAP